MDEVPGDPELLRLTADAKRIDDQLAELQPKANASRHGSVERRRYSELRDRSDAAWRWVRDRVMMLKSLAGKLR